MEEVYEFSAGKNDWNSFRIGVDEGRIVVKDQTGHIEFEERDVDELIQGIDQARRRLREKAREPTARRDATQEEEPDEPAEMEEEPAEGEVEETPEEVAPADEDEEPEF